MDFIDPLVALYDLKRCVREEDDPAEAIVFFRAGSEVSLEARCSWCSHLAGLYRFWETSLKSPLKFSVVGNRLFGLRKVSDGYLVILGWTESAEVSEDVVKVALDENINFLVGVLEFFVGRGVGAVKDSEEMEIVMSALLQHYSLSYGDLRIMKDLSHMFKGSQRLQSMARIIFDACHRLFDAEAFNTTTRLLACCLFFRADVVDHEIPFSLDAIARKMLIGAFLPDVAVEKGDCGADSTGAMDASEHLEFYNVFLAVEEQETLRLLRNIRLAANVVRAADMRHHFGPAKEKSKSSEPRIVTTQSELEFPASLVVFGFFDVRLALLVDYVELAPAEKYRLVAMWHNLLPVVELLHTAGLEHVLSQTMLSMNENFKKGSRQSIYEYDETRRCFSSLPEDENELMMVQETFFRIHRHPPHSAKNFRLKRKEMSCSVDRTSDGLRFTLERD